ncbi:MAG: hypothetical protein A3H28_00745 [Acidobacteria bacterium RIFCSPLOWO2_02_FULL_61_28]|nr:MAG: hypothetical protein A3H28_00745 [Acidobacteria bacterium RIFCSPLOWO2_02_FULL_61_28]
MKSKQWRGRWGALLLAGTVSVGVWMIVSGPAPRGGMQAASEAALRSPSGEAQLVSVEPLPALEGEMKDGEMCEWMPASANTTVLAALQEQPAPARNSTPAQLAEVKNRKPVRMIKDTYPSYSSVAVDFANNEVVMTDESLFQILTYNRTENTPPRAAMSEPKRIIAGLETSIEYQCGLYIDQATGDIYAVNNDTVDKLVIFSRHAKGNVPPDRILETPHTTYGIAVDEAHQELFLTVQEAAAVVVYRKTAKDNEAPIRLLQGGKTGLADPHGLAVDPKNDLLLVANFGSMAQHDRSTAPKAGDGSYYGRYAFLSNKPNWPLSRQSAVPGTGKFLPPSITVYPRSVSGDTAPIRVIQGPKTQLNWPTALSIDPERGEIYVANDTGDSILVFSVTADGDVAPLRVIKGPKSMIKSPTGIFFDTKNQELWVSNFGNHTATVYKPTASGDAPPLRVIRSAPPDRPSPNIGNAFAAAYDSKRDEILVPN